MHHTMQYYRLNSVYMLLVFYILLLTSTVATDESINCQDPETDQAILVQDFGPGGVSGHFNVSIVNSLQPGAVISVVTKSEIRGSVNLIADDIYVLHVDTRIQANQLVLATSKRLNLEWHDTVMLPNPVAKNTKATTTLVYDVDGFRVYINGQKVAFYVHRTNKSPRVLNFQHDYVYKIMYLTTRETGK